jgi:hypothetical protein
MICGTKRVLLFAFVLSLASARPQSDESDKDAVAPATLATPTALFKCGEVSRTLYLNLSKQFI